MNIAQMYHDVQGLSSRGWLVKDVIPFKFNNLLFGSAGSGKTWLALHLAVCADLGLDFLGKYPTIQSSVIYIDQDSTPDVTIPRLGLIANAYGAEISDLDIRLESNRGFSLSSRSSVRDLCAEIRALAHPLVIIDTLNKSMQGLNPNQTKDAIIATNALKDLIEAGATVVTIHHATSKRKNDSKIFFDDDVSIDALPMGNSEFVGAADSLFYACGLGTEPLTIGLRTKPKRLQLAIPERVIVQMVTTADMASFKMTSKIPVQPSEEAKVLASLFLEHPKVWYSVADVLDVTGQLFPIHGIRDGLRELRDQKFINFSVGSHNQFRYTLNPDRKKENSEYQTLLL